MPTTTHTRISHLSAELSPALTWRTWPLVDAQPWSWLVPIGIVAMAAGAWYLSGGWLVPLAAVAGLAVTLRQYLLPIEYEITSLGIRRRTLRWSRLIPWHAVRAYQFRPTGIVLYQRSDASKFDLLRSFFVPYPPDADELVAPIRSHLPHAVEMAS